MRYKRKEPGLQVGDTIRCHDKNEMVNISMELDNEGIDNDSCMRRTVKRDCG